MVVVVATRGDERRPRRAHLRFEPQRVDSERAERLERGDFEVDVTQVGAGRCVAVSRTDGFERRQIERVGANRYATVVGRRPRGTREIPVQFDTVPLRVREVERLAHVVVRSAVEFPPLAYPREGVTQGFPRRESERIMVESSSGAGASGHHPVTVENEQRCAVSSQDRRVWLAVEDVEADHRPIELDHLSEVRHLERGSTETGRCRKRRSVGHGRSPTTVPYRVISKE